MTSIITRSTTLDNIESLKILSEIASNLTVLGKQEILSFLENNNWLIEKCLPTDTDKNVVTGRASSVSARMELSGIKTILNNPGTPQRFKGLNDQEKKTSAVKAVGFAFQHRYSTLGVDLDCDVFDGVDENGNLVSKLPEKLIEWVATHHPYALKVQGNRKRLTLIFALTPELNEHLVKVSRHKFNYTLTNGNNQRVEVGFGNVNNTVYGVHPTAKFYQQSLPIGGELGQLSLESFTELQDILDEVSLVVDKKYRTASSGRTLLIDAYESFSSINNDIANYVNMIEKLDLDVDLSVSIREFLNPETNAIIEGEKCFDGTHYIEIDKDDDHPIKSGNRFFTYFNVGSDVNAVAYILEKSDVYFDPNEIDDIIDELWERTDSEGNGSKTDKYYQHEAIAAFNATATYPTIKTDYLSVIIQRIRKELNDRLMSAIENKKTESNAETLQEVAEKVKEKFMEQEIKQETKVAQNEDDNVFSFDDCVENSIIDLAKKEKEIREKNEALEPKTKLPEINTEELVESVGEYTERKASARNRAKSDDWTIFNPLLKEVLEFSNDARVDGYSYGIMTQTLSFLAGVGGYVTIKNTEYEPQKTIESLNPYRTAFIPFSAIVSDSGVGKSQVRNSFHKEAIKFIDEHQKLTDEEQEIFKAKFGSPKNPEKLKASEIDETTNKPKDPLLSKVISIINKAKSTLPSVVAMQPNCVTSDTTDAGYRDNLIAQQAHVSIKKATNGICFPNAYSHPVTMYSDELNSVFKKMFDSAIVYGGSPEFFMERKDAGMMKIARGGHIFDFSVAGLAITGNMVTAKVTEYISKELKEGTDGVTPRFNFAYIEKDEEKDISSIKWGRTRKEDAKVDMAGIMFTARYASIHAKNLINCPYADNTPLEYSFEAQEEYGRFLESTKKLKNSLLGKFSKAEPYLNSMFGKASSELAIYAGGINLLNQCTKLWEACKKYLPGYEEMKRLLLSNENENLLKLGEQIESALAMVITDFKWSLSITDEDIKNSSKIVYHHYDFIEFQLDKLKTQSETDSNERVKEATKDKILTSVEGDSYVQETHIKKVAISISETLQMKGEEEEFSVSDLHRRCATVRRLINDGNKTRVYQILNLLEGVGILERLEELTRKGNPKYKLKTTIANLNKQIPVIVASVRGK